MPTVSANGLEIAYEVVGDGPPLVVLHAAATSGRGHIGPHLDRLARRYRVHLVDARGHGGTRWDAADGFAMPMLVADVFGFVDALALDRFHLLGFSMGAMTSLWMASSVPERLLTLTLVSISPEREPRASVAARLLDPERIERDDPRWARDLEARHGPVQGPGAWRRLLPAVAADVATQPLLGPEALRAVDIPTLLACGDRDPFVPVGQAWALRRALPRARLLIAPDCGHEVMTERPAVFAAALDDFHREEDPR